jgi:hypothetical protein
VPDKTVKPQDTSGNTGFWSSPWTVGIVTTVLGALLAPLVSLAFQFPAPVLRTLKFIGLGVLILAGILLFGLAQQSVAMGRIVGAIYGFMIGSIIGGLILDYAQPPFPLFAPHQSVSLLSPPVGGGFILWLAWATPIIGALVGAHIKGRRS